jgi:hypothetical protein
MSNYKQIFYKKTENFSEHVNDNKLYISHRAGFYSCCTMLLESILRYFNKNKTLPVLYTTELFTHYKPHSNKGDVRNLFFKEQEDTIPYYKEIKTTDLKEEQQFSDYQKLNYDDLRPFIKKYFSLSSQILDNITVLEKKYSISYNNLLSVYYRGTDKHLETKLIPYETIIENIRSLKKDNPSLTILVQTDEQSFSTLVKNEFPDTIVPDELNETTSFLNIVSADADASYKHAIHLLSLVSMISKSKYIIMTSGNVSLWMCLLRGNATNVYQHLDSLRY